MNDGWMKAIQPQITMPNIAREVRTDKQKLMYKPDCSGPTES